MHTAHRTAIAAYCQAVAAEHAAAERLTAARAHALSIGKRGRETGDWIGHTDAMFRWHAAQDIHRAACDEIERCIADLAAARAAGVLS